MYYGLEMQEMSIGVYAKPYHELQRDNNLELFNEFIEVKQAQQKPKEELGFKPGC